MLDTVLHELQEGVLWVQLVDVVDELCDDLRVCLGFKGVALAAQELLDVLVVQDDTCQSNKNK